MKNLFMCVTILRNTLIFCVELCFYTLRYYYNMVCRDEHNLITMNRLLNYKHEKHNFFVLAHKIHQVQGN